MLSCHVQCSHLPGCQLKHLPNFLAGLISRVRRARLIPNAAFLDVQCNYAGRLYTNFSKTANDAVADGIHPPWVTTTFFVRPGFNAPLGTRPAHLMWAWWSGSCFGIQVRGCISIQVRDGCYATCVYKVLWNRTVSPLSPVASAVTMSLGPRLLVLLPLLWHSVSATPAGPGVFPAGYQSPAVNSSDGEMSVEGYGLIEQYDSSNWLSKFDVQAVSTCLSVRGCLLTVYRLVTRPVSNNRNLAITLRENIDI